MTLVECTSDPFVPVIAIVYVPAKTPPVPTFIVEEPDPFSDVGENVGVGPAGVTVALSCTLPVNPPVAAMVTV